MKENLLKMVVCGGTSFSFLENQRFHDTISHAIQIEAKYGSSNLLGPGSGFIWVTWVQGQQKWPSFICGTNKNIVAGWINGLKTRTQVEHRRGADID